MEGNVVGCEGFFSPVAVWDTPVVPVSITDNSLRLNRSTDSLTISLHIVNQSTNYLKNPGLVH